MTGTGHSRFSLLAGWFAYASGVVAISGLIPFVIFPFGLNIPRLNDTAAIAQYLLALPIVLALHRSVRVHARIRSWLATLSAIVGIVGVAVVQVLWLLEWLGLPTYYILIGTAILLVDVWLVITGYCLRRSHGPLRQSLLMSILAATYFGYPIWAIWLGRLLLADELTRAGPAAKAELA